MQYLIDFLSRHSQAEKLKEKFPDMFEFSKTVEVIPWRKEFEVKDKNPEVIDLIEFLDLLLKNKMITLEQYQQQLNEVVKGFASKTLAIAFIEEKQVSFRSEVPDLDTILHELGHVYFEVNDLIWNASYGGGEILLHLALQDKYKINEGHIRRYHAYLIQTFENPEFIHKKIAETIAPKIKVYPHLFPICLFEGYIPEFPEKVAPDIYDDLQSPGWAKYTVKQHNLFMFFQNLVSGLVYRDSYSINCAKWLDIID